MKKVIVLLCMLTLGLTGCGKQEELSLEISNHIEKSVLQEGSEEEATQLADLEKQEKTIYTQITALMGEGKKKEIKEQAQQAIEIVKKRQEHINNRKVKMEEALKEINAAEELIATLKKSQYRESGQDVITVAKNRINNSIETLNAYITGLQHDEALYTLFINSDFDNEKITKEVTAINNSYTNVLQLNEEHKNLTEEFNKKKEAFYTLIGAISTDKE